MSLPVLHHRLHRPVTGQDHAGSAATRAEESASAARMQREQRIDEELAQSFPASDPPSWVQGVSLPPS